jgi:site-specific recombinase XerD
MLKHERAVVDLWRRGHLCHGTIQIYLQWVRRFVAYCERRKLDQSEQLTSSGVLRFIGAYAGRGLKGRVVAGETRNVARNGLHAWACALGSLAVAVPIWREKEARPMPPLIYEYRRYRKAHNGVADGTLVRDVAVACGFLNELRCRRKPVARATLADVDTFVCKTASRVSKSTVADTCSSLRSFLRFLHTTGKMPSNLAKSVFGPRFCRSERPPRTLPWTDVQAILRSIGQSEPPGKRDFAILLLLATYGLGAAEVLGLRLGDVDWRAGILRARRPKTKTHIELPLLPGVAKALTAYLRWERPPATGIPFLFLRTIMPYEPMTSGALRHRIRYYAGLVGIRAKVIGAHAFRHSHASRQVDAGTNIKILSEILGHGSSSSTSTYVRVAVERLRTVALPVPR